MDKERPASDEEHRESFGDKEQIRIVTIIQQNAVVVNGWSVEESPRAEESEPEADEPGK